MSDLGKPRPSMCRTVYSMDGLSVVNLGVDWRMEDRVEREVDQEG
jgi:hypothetical protein